VSVLREDLLRGVVAAFGGDPEGGVCERLRMLGAQVEVLPASLDDDAVEAWAGDRAPLDALVFDVRPRFRDGLGAALEATWKAIRAVSNGALIGTDRPAKIVLLAPAPGALHAEAARAAVENLARTLSVEWARYQLTTTALMPDEHAREQQLAEAVAFLVSRAGAYFSGCRLDLGVTAVASPLR
jgi:hypothetical protein